MKEIKNLIFDILKDAKEKLTEEEYLKLLGDIELEAYAERRELIGEQIAL